MKGSGTLKKFALLLFVVMLMSSFMVGCGEKAPELKVFNWGDYIDPSVLDEFEKETGIKVIYETFATNEEMYVKIKQGGSSYDVAMPSDYMIKKMLDEDMLEEINYDNVPNMDGIGDQYKNLGFDPENKFSVPYMWGTVGVVYNKNMVEGTPDSWDILWNEKYQGQILMYDSQRDTMMVALKKLGYSMNTKNVAELEEAKELLLEQKPLVLAYVGDNVKPMMIGEEAAMAVVYSGEAVFMIEENSNLEYFVPNEGSNYWYDNMIIPKGAENKEAAEKFINFMCRPDIALKNVEYIGYSTPVLETQEMLPEEVRTNDDSYPDLSKLNNMEIFLDPGDFIDEYNRIWTEFRAE